MADDMNGWAEYSRHVLKELERLNIGQERAAEKLQELRDGMDGKLSAALGPVREELNMLQSKIAHFEPNKVVQLEVEMAGLKKWADGTETKLRALELSSSTFGGKWTVISAVGAVLLSAVVSLIFSMAKAEDAPQKEVAHSISP